jgi:hypothetical protein
MKNEKTIKESKRKKALGELGELIGVKTLVDSGFLEIMNLNDKKMNYPFADLFATKEGKRFVISIKARNKIQRDGNLNARYILGRDVLTKASKAVKEFNATPAWMAISFTEKTYSVYFGTLDQLKNPDAIPVSECMKKKLGQCLVEDKVHYFDWDYFKNEI